MPGSIYPGQLYPGFYSPPTEAVPGAPVQATQLVVELLDVVPASPLSATQLAVEFLFANANEARATQLACELIVLAFEEIVPCPTDFPTDVAAAPANCSLRVFPIDSD
jgi:hypothetical protein